jgi:hypothetical protein
MLWGALLVAVQVTSGSAQRVSTKPPACARVDTTAAWYLQQKAWWLLDAAHDWTNDTLRIQLLDAARPLDHVTSNPFPLQVGVTVVGEPEVVLHGADSLRLMAMRDKLRDMLKTRTWPTRTLVGPAGVRAAWLVSRGDSALGIGAMHRMMEAGPGEASAADVAVLEDWSRVLKGRKPIYASRVARDRELSGGIATLKWLPTEDMAHVNLRRDAAGLPSTVVGLCLMQSQK